jgi:hypothetical protein
MLLVKTRVVARGELRHVVGFQVFGDIAESSANNLLDLTRVKVNAWSEFGHSACVIAIARIE